MEGVCREVCRKALNEDLHNVPLAGLVMCLVGLLVGGDDRDVIVYLREGRYTRHASSTQR